MFLKTEIGEYININKVIMFYIVEQPMRPLSSTWEVYCDDERFKRHFIAEFGTEEEAETYIEKILKNLLIKKEV